MLCPVAWFLACHTSGWIECLERMDEHLAHPPVQVSSVAVATWRQVVRSPALAGLFLAVLVGLLAWPRLTGPSWWALGMPFDLRESEGNTVQWEQVYLFNALRVTLQSDASTAIEWHYNTDHYRALLPTYVSAIFSWWLDSSYMGFALVDLLGWWMAAWTLYYLARRLDADRLAAFIAAVLLAASPLMVNTMWSQGLHVVHSASLVPCFFVALLSLTDRRLVHGWRVIALASVLYIASLTYQYQWIIVPCLLSIAVIGKRRWIGTISVLAAVIVFIGMTVLTYKFLSLVDLSVHSRSNEPLTLVRSQLALVMDGGMLELGRGILKVIELLIKSYHPFIFLLSLLGMIFACARLRILICVGTVLGLMSGYLYPVSWVTMNGYPFMYISAGLVLVRGPGRLADFATQIGSIKYPQSAERIASVGRVLARLSTVTLILIAVLSTNADILGDYSFVQQWWSFRYDLR